MNPKSYPAFFAKLSDAQKKQFIGKVDKVSNPELLNPALNKYNSVRVQYLKHSGNYISSANEDSVCNFPNCGRVIHQHSTYYHGFDKPDRQGQVCKDVTRIDDVQGVGTRAKPSHNIECHLMETKTGRVMASGKGIKI